MRIKPDKPSPEFPLFPHHRGYWAKKIAGRTIYFGPWEDPDGAIAAYDRERSDWEAGRNPRTKIDASEIDPAVGVRLGDGCNLFLDDCLQRVEAGRLSQRSYDDYKATLALVLLAVDRWTPVNSMKPDDWKRILQKLSAGRSSSTIANEVTRVKVAMRWLVANRYIDRDPYYGAEFKKPTKVSIRRSRANQGKRWFEAKEIRSLVAASSPAMKAMILLGINCGFGNGDCSGLQPEWISGEWIDYDRPKTGVKRRAKLWPETIAALAAWKEVRPKVNLPLVFVTRQGNAWSDPDSADCAIAKLFVKLCRECKVYIPGRGFYSLRRTFETIASGTKDQVAVSSVMGHVDDSMSGIYRQYIGDERLVAVSEFVRTWYLSG